MAEIILYVDRNFGGLHTHLFESTADFKQLALGGTGTNVTGGGGQDGTWNDKVSSFVIVSGSWQFFQDLNFRGQRAGPLGPGLYPWVEDFGIDNDSLSSIRLVGY
jgi:hypothetical protein